MALQQEYHVTEKREEQPAAMNAFELISMSKGLNLGNLFDVEQVTILSFNKYSLDLKIKSRCLFGMFLKLRDHFLFYYVIDVPYLTIVGNNTRSLLQQFFL